MNDGAYDTYSKNSHSNKFLGEWKQQNLTNVIFYPTLKMTMDKPHSQYDIFQENGPLDFEALERYFIPQITIR